jgi:hypothetical protein
MASNFDVLFKHERELLLEVLRERMRKEFSRSTKICNEGSIAASTSLMHGRRIQRLLETLNPKGSAASPKTRLPGTHHEGATSSNNYLLDT